MGKEGCGANDIDLSGSFAFSLPALSETSCCLLEAVCDRCKLYAKAEISREEGTGVLQPAIDPLPLPRELKHTRRNTFYYANLEM